MAVLGGPGAPDLTSGLAPIIARAARSGAGSPVYRIRSSAPAGSPPTDRRCDPHVLLYGPDDAQRPALAQMLRDRHRRPRTSGPVAAPPSMDTKALIAFRR